MIPDTIAAVLSRLAEEEPHRFKIDSAWLWLVTPVALFAATAVVKAFTAEDRVRESCADRIAAVKDAIFSADVHPALAEIIVKIYRYFPVEIAKIVVKGKEYLPGQPGNDPELEAQRILGYRTASFAVSLTSLENHYGTIHRASSVHGRIVAHKQRCGAAMGVFLIGWLYFGCYLLFPDIEFPDSLTIASVALMCATLGWAACEWWGGNRENNALSKMARDAQQDSTGQTS